MSILNIMFLQGILICILKFFFTENYVFVFTHYKPENWSLKTKKMYSNYEKYRSQYIFFIAKIE